MNKLSSLTIFFPAYNEAANIPHVLKKATTTANLVAKDWEILVINDGSTDKTAARVQSFSKKYPQVKLINHSKNKGYGAALKTGFQSAKKDWIFFSDGDGQFNLAELQRFIPYTTSHQVIIGYRPKRSEGLGRTINASLWRYLNLIVFRLQVKDIDCAFKLIKRKTIRRLELVSEGAMLSAEILIKLQQSGHPIMEIPISHKPRLSGTPTGANPLVILRAFKEFIILYYLLKSPAQSQFLRFALVGALGTILDFTALNAAYLLLHLNLYIALTFGFTIGTLNNYFLNSSWTFKQPLSGKKMLQFALIGGTGLLINNGLVYLLVERLNVYYNLAKALAVLLILLWNYFLNRRFTFRIQK